jgi:hypothetical protein
VEIERGNKIVHEENVRVVAKSENTSAGETSGLVENMRGKEERIKEAERGNKESEENQVETDSSGTKNRKLSDKEKLEIFKEMHNHQLEDTQG